MQKLLRHAFIDPLFFVSISFLLILSIVVLRSITPSLFPGYFVFIIAALIVFFLFLQVDFVFWSVFSKYLYIGSIILLILPLFIGQVTRGTVRWIPIGGFSLQPSEIVRPFLMLHAASLFAGKELNLKLFIRNSLILALPVALILIQPSLGVSILTSIGFFGVILASTINKKYIALGFLIVAVLIPLFWLILAPYQKQRITAFLDPNSDPYGVGYNSIQSMISVGSGKLLGRGIGEGVQTQLAFLPEKNTDFIFASTAEELGFTGASFLLISLFLLLWRISSIMSNSVNPEARAFVSGILLILLAEIIVHVGMNMGLLPITGVPLPLVSSGGSALLGTFMSLAMVLSARNMKENL